MTDPVLAADVQRWAVIVTAANSVITAGVAIAATWFSHKFTDTREQRKERVEADDRRDDRIQQKLEELVDALAEHLEEQQRQALRLVFVGVSHANGVPITENKESEKVPAMSRALMIVRLYFPEWHEPTSKVTAANLALTQFWSAEANSIAANARNWDATARPTYVERQAPLQKAVMTAVDDIAGLARARIVLLHAPPVAPKASGAHLCGWLWGKR
jgi:hypothetical protein